MMGLFAWENIDELSHDQCCCICFCPLYPPKYKTTVCRLLFMFKRCIGVYGNLYKLWRCRECHADVHHTCMMKWKIVYARKLRTSPIERVGCPLCRVRVTNLFA